MRFVLRLASLIALLLNPRLAIADGEFTLAAPDYAWSFPRDHASHDSYKTEWWYYTGHLDCAETKETFSFQLTFFRSKLGRAELSEDDIAEMEEADSNYAIDQLYWAHAAIGDLNAGTFHHAELLNRGGIGVAGSREDTLHAWNGKWSTESMGDTHALRTEIRDENSGTAWTLRLLATPSRDPVLQGDNGFSRKTDGEGRASMYYSLPTMKVEGIVYKNDKPLAVTGSCWMDHEFMSNVLDERQAGWDWFGLQLDDGSALMVYQLRRKDGSVDPFSAGTFIPRDGEPRKLARADFDISPTGTWMSPSTSTEYPAGWTIVVRPLALELTLTPSIANQELTTKQTGRLNYWEGSVRITGTRGAEEITGRGFAELVGYGEAFDKSL